MRAKDLVTLDLSGGTIGAAAPPECVISGIAPNDRSPRLRGGDPELKQAFASEFLRAAGFAPPPENILTVNGGCTEALELALDYCLYRKGRTDRKHKAKIYSFFSPAWFGYWGLIRERALNLGEFLTYPEENFLPNPEQFTGVWDEDAYVCAAVVVNHYATPCGTCMSEQQVQALGEKILSLPGRPFVIEDCLFWKNGLDQRRLPTLGRIVPELWEEGRLIGVTSLSKAWALTDNDIGFVWGSRAFCKFAADLSQIRRLVPSTKLQRALCGAFSVEGLRVCKKVVTATKHNLTRLQALTKKTSFVLACVPEGGINALLDVRGLIGRRFGRKVICCANCLANLLVKHYCLALAPGYDFGCRFPALRINLAGASEEQFNQAMERLHEFNTLCCGNAL